MTFLNLDLFAIALFGFLVLVEPWLGFRAIAKLKREAAAGLPGARLRAYRGTIISLWGLALAVLVVWLVMGRSLGDAGLVLRQGLWSWLSFGTALIAVGIFAAYILRIARDPEQVEQVRGQAGDILVLAPHDDRESRRFELLSLTAGICEEFVYRGVLMTVLAWAYGTWPAVALSSLAFGIGHCYQGAGGVLKTGLIGVVMALITVFSGSIFAGMIVHAVFDMAQGRLLRAATEVPITSPE